MTFRLARIKADAKRKREEREREEEMRMMENDRRHNMLVQQFKQWFSGPQGLDPRIGLALLQNALRLLYSYCAYVIFFPKYFLVTSLVFRD